MKALILNSGMGKRMGTYTDHCPKCMVPLAGEETILGRQLKMVCSQGVEEAVITTGFYHELMKDYIESLNLPLKTELVYNPRYGDTNYIYSIYLARNLVQGDIVLMHGDLVFETAAFRDILNSSQSCMAVSSVVELPEKDFKAVVKQERITAVGVEFFEHALAAQPLYYFRQEHWSLWLDQIAAFCEAGDTNCYAEKALNTILDRFLLAPRDTGDMLCMEVDKEEDLIRARERLAGLIHDI